MRPQERVWRKDGRREVRRSQEHELRPELTVRQQEQALVEETSAMLARQAHIDAAWDLPFLVNGMPGVTVLTLDD